MCVYVGVVSFFCFVFCLLLLSKQILKMTRVFEKTTTDLNLIKAAFRNKTKYKLKAV